MPPEQIELLVMHADEPRGHEGERGVPAEEAAVVDVAFAVVGLRRAAGVPQVWPYGRSRLTMVLVAPWRR